MLFLREIFVKLLVFKGLASEPPPIDRKRQDSKICLDNSPTHHSQPNLRIPTRSTDSAAARHLAGGGFVHSGLPNSQYGAPLYRRRGAGSVIHSCIHRLSAWGVAGDPRDVREESVWGPGRGVGRFRAARGGVLTAVRECIHDFWAEPRPLGARPTA